jgi:hypothetical protein
VDDVVLERANKQTVTHQDMVQVLGVAFEDISVALVLRQRFNQGMQNATFQGVKGGGKGEVVEIAQDDDLCIRIQSQNTVHEVVHDLRLLSTLHLGTERRRLEPAEKRIVSAFRVEVIPDDKQLLAAKGKLTRERFAAGVEGSVSRIDAARTKGELGAPWTTAYSGSTR